MNPVLEYITGMNTLTDGIIATDMLLSAKSGVRNYAMAVTEAATPEIRETLSLQLEEALDLYEEIVTYMITKGLYHPWNVKEQLLMDLRNTETVLNLI